jgi:TP901 family phage tail tape measure protein
MAGIRADVNLNVNTSQAKRSMDRAAAEINKVVNNIGGKQISFNVNGRSFTQPLGRITASANEFTKSLEASNARVIAFGASVGIINGISDAFKNLVLETVKFEKTLMDINVVLNASSQSLQEFGSGLFDVAKNTAQSFTVASEAALEFSRQGLTMEEVLIRTNDALTLTRLTGLKAAEAVSGLTAAVNAFGQAGLSTTDIIDKLAAVDVQFAVSSEDLINALERTGAVAIDAGVEIDSLIGLVTALQQTTARGGAVIGNGLKTIFTRIQRPQSIQQLEDMGIAVKNLSGAILPADKIMLNMAKSFDSLTQSQQSNIVQFSAGIFQANVFRAALKDLSKEQSIQAQATKIAGDASGDAAVKNEMLNKTMSAMASQTVSSIEELAETIGKLAFTPEIGGFLSFIQDGVEGIKNMLGGGEEEGDAFAKGLVKGIGNVLTGPAAIAFGAIFIKLFVNISKFANNSLKDVLGIVSEKDKVKQMEESITKALSDNLKLQEGLNNLEGDRKAQEQFILGIIEKQNKAMAEQANLAARLAKPLVRAGINPDFTSSAPVTASSGVLPEAAKKERKGASRGGYSAGAVDSMDIPGMGEVVYNKAEKVKQFPGMRQPAIMPPEQSRAGRTYRDAFAGQHGFDPYASGGLIPNFARMEGSKLVLDKSKMKLMADPQQARVGQKIRKSYAELSNSGRPVNIEADINNLTVGRGGSHTAKIKDVLSFLRSEGVGSIERPFDLEKLPFRGKKDGQGAEKASLKALGTKYFSTGGKSGDETFPVDLAGLDMTPYEVKSGQWKLPNVLLKSLRLYTDDGLLTFAEKYFGADREMIQEARDEKFKKSSGLLKKKGFIKEGLNRKEQEDIINRFLLHGGLIPNFADDKVKPVKSIANIIDGDSIEADILVGTQRVDHRLQGVDAVEKNQAYGTRATTIAKNFYNDDKKGRLRLRDRIVQDGKAAYGRGLFKDQDLARTLIEKGYGVPDAGYLNKSEYFKYQEIAEKAKSKGVGIWRDKTKKTGKYRHPKAQFYLHQQGIVQKADKWKDVTVSDTRFYKEGVNLSNKKFKGYADGGRKFRHSGLIPNFIDTRTRQQKIQDVLRDPANKGINFKGGALAPMSIKSKNMFHQMFLESYVNKGLESDYDMLVKMGYDPQEITAARKHKQKGGKVNVLAKGHVPNFAASWKRFKKFDKNQYLKSLKKGKSNNEQAKIDAYVKAAGGAQKFQRLNEKFGLDKVDDIFQILGFAKGYVPNFANPLEDAISREKAAGVPQERIRVEKSSQLKGPQNPMGLAVTNTRDEPAGVQQGIRRAKSMGVNPKEHGANVGFVPNFESDDSRVQRLEKGTSVKVGFKDLENSVKKLSSSVDKAAKKISENQKKIDNKSASLNKEELLKNENDIIKKMTTAKKGELRGLKAQFDANLKLRESVHESTRAIDDSSDAEGSSLQKLFYMQSAISLVNGQFEQLSETSSGMTKVFADAILGVSNLTAAYIQQKELVSEGMNMLGTKRSESFSLGQIVDPEARQSRRRAAAAAEARVSGSRVGRGGALSGLIGGAGKLSRAFGRFLPLVGQAYTLFTGLNEAFKFFNIGEMFGLEKGSGLMDLLSTTSERASKKIEKLGESTDKLQSAFESLQTQSQNNEKIDELEILGARRTQKQELKLQELKLKGFDLEVKSQEAMSALLDENMVGSKVAQKFTEELAKGTTGNEDYSRIIKEVIAAQRKQMSFLQGTKSFGELIDKKLDVFSADKGEEKFLKSAAKMRGSQLGMGLSSVLAGEESAETEDRLKILNRNIAALSKETSVDLTSMGDLSSLTDRLSSGLKGTENFDSEMIASQINMLGNNIDEAIDNTSGLHKVESEAFGGAMEKIVSQLRIFKKQLEGESERKQEVQLKKEYIEAYKQVIFEIGEFRKNTKHESKLSLEALKHSSSILLSSEKLSLQYNAIEKEAAISLEFARKRNEIDSKFTNDLQAAEIGVIDSLNKTRDTYLNTEALASMFNKKGSEADKAVGELKKKINEGVKATDFSAVQTELGITLDSSAMDSINKIFQDVADESKNFNSNIQIMTMLAKKHGEILDSNNSAALITLLHQKGIVNISAEDLIKAKQILKEKDRKLESLKQSADNQKAITDQNEKERLISEKTVKGATALFRHLGMDVDAQAAITKNRENILKSIKGEAMHMAVTNKQGEGLASAVAQSLEMQQKGLESQKEKNRNDAIAAVLSLRQLEAQTGALAESEDNKIILEAKNKSEILNAERAAQESQSRLEFLSGQKSRSELVKQQLAKEIADLRSGNLLAAEKNKQLSEGKALTELVGEQREQALHSARLEALIAAENAILLTEKGKQAKLIQQANELQEASNKLTEFQNAITKAKVDKRALAVTAGADIGIEKANAIASTRTAGMRAQIDPSAENMAAYAASLEETNKLLGNGSRAMDRLRSKMAELNVGAENLGADLVDIGIDNARSGLKQLFKDIGSGSKSASEAWSDFGLGLADQLLDRMMDANIDKILKDLTFAFTGEEGKSDEAKMTDEMRHFGGVLEKLNTPLGDLTSEVRALKEVMQNQISKEEGVNTPPDAKIPDGSTFKPGQSPGGAFADVQIQSQIAKDIQGAKTFVKTFKDASIDIFTDFASRAIGIFKGLTQSQATEAGTAKSKEYRTTDLYEAQDELSSFKQNNLFKPKPKQINQMNFSEKGDYVLEQLMPINEEMQMSEYKEQRSNIFNQEAKNNIIAKSIEEKKLKELEERLAQVKKIENPSRGEHQELKTLKTEINESKGKIKDLGKKIKPVIENLEGLDEEFNQAKSALQELTSKVGEINKNLRLQEINIPELQTSTDRLMQNSNPEAYKILTGGMLSGGKIQHFAKGGFVDGPAGVDKVPAMLTAGEYVVPKEQAKQFKHSGGEIQNFSIGGMAKELNNPNTESRPIRGAQGVTQLLVMNEVARGVAKYLEKPKDDGPPTFDKNKFNNLDLRSDVNIKRGDPRLSARFLAKDPVMQEYRDYLLEKAAYDVEKKNQKVDKKMQTIGSIVSFMSTFAMAEMTSAMKPYVEKAVGWAKDKATNLTKGHMGLGEHSKAFKQARKQNIDMDYSDLKGAESTGYLISNDNKAYAMSRKGTWNLDPSKTLSHRRALQENIKKQSTKRQSGGSVPAMLTAGEGFVPAAIAKRIGYDNLNRMNTTGDLPIIQGKGGIDNVGPVGLTEGDFIIKKSSTDKLLRENPNMMRFALQNPEGFKRGERGYYEGGVVGDAPAVPTSSVPRAAPTNRIKNSNPVEMFNQSFNQKSEPAVATQQKSETTNNINVNVTIDQTGKESVSTDGSASSYEEEQQLSLKIKSAVMDVIREEKRIGGELSS